MKKLILLSILFIIGCALKLTHVNHDNIKKECKIKCQTYEVSSDDWCNCI